MESLGYLLAMLIGLLLSLLGGGGSILTVPVLVYLFGFAPATATGYSLLIVGAASAVAAAGYWRQGLVSPKTALFFSFPSFVMVYLTRRFGVPLLPEVLVRTPSFTLTKDAFLLLLFASLMLLASGSMIRGRRQPIQDDFETARRLNYPLIFAEGLLVGTLTGLVGVGGGFLIIPVLTAFVRLPMKLAVGTSLLIIAINSLIGFLGELGQRPMDWRFLGTFLALTLVGVGLGQWASRRVSGAALRPAFGYLMLLMGGWIVAKELFLN
jgi:uncharacterized membrane protein YfcA